MNRRPSLREAPDRIVAVGVSLAGILALLLFAGVASLGGCRARTASAASRTVTFTYRFTVTNVPPGADTVTAWAPLPSRHRYQEVEALRIDTDHPYRIVTDPVYSNRILRVDLSDAPGGGREVAIVFRATRRAYNVLNGDEAPEQAAHRQPAAFLQAASMIPIGGMIAREAEAIAGEAQDPLDKARRLYDHIVASMQYDKSGEGWGRGDAVYACSIRKGNCTDFHSLYMGEARALKLPARFIVGFPLPPEGDAGEIGGYHCWAQFHVDGRGWVPVDASEASKQPEKKEQFFGGLDEHRVGFTVGRDVTLPGAATEPLNFFIYPHVEIDGKKHAGVATAFHFEATGG